MLIKNQPALLQRYLSITSITILLFMGACSSKKLTTTTIASSKPNILLILMDDLGYADVGFMPNAAEDIYTPTIDQLAKDGTIFTNAYVTHPFCGPSRTSIMTGRGPHDLGAQYNLAAFSGNGIDTTEAFISDVLDKAGYYTGVVGKWHLGEEDRFHPYNRGFDYFYGFLGGGHEYFSDTWLSHEGYNHTDPQYKVGDYEKNYKRPMMEGWEYLPSEKGLYCTDVLTDAAVKFIDNAAEGKDPFFLYMSYNAPHTPVQAKEADILDIQNVLGEKAAATGSERLTYTAMMYNVDYNIKRMVEHLKNTGLYDNTLIVFLSDNGGKTTAGANNAPLRGKKGDAYEGGFRVPMFVHWSKGNVQRGVTNAYNVSSLDFYPTFTRLAGAEVPSGKIYDGMDIWDHITNHTNPRKDSSIFVMRHSQGNNYTGVVRNHYKLYTNGTGEWSLFDLRSDIGETKDVSTENSSLVNSMKTAVYQWSQGHKQPQFFDNPRFGFETTWHEKNMPNFQKTFGELYQSEDYSDEEVIVSEF